MYIDKAKFIEKIKINRIGICELVDEAVQEKDIEWRQNFQWQKK